MTCRWGGERGGAGAVPAGVSESGGIHAGGAVSLIAADLEDGVFGKSFDARPV